MNENITQQIGENLRFYADMRFKQLTLFVALLSLVGAGILHSGQRELVTGVEYREVLAIAGMLFTAVLWMMEIRSTLYWVAHRESIPDLWPRPTKAIWGWLNATNSLLVLYFLTFCFFGFCVHEWIAKPTVTFGVTLLGVVFLIFSITNYINLWSHKEE